MREKLEIIVVINEIAIYRPNFEMSAENYLLFSAI